MIWLGVVTVENNNPREHPEANHFLMSSQRVEKGAIGYSTNTLRPSFSRFSR